MYIVLLQSPEAEKNMIRIMQITDYQQVYELWQRIHGLGIRSVDDSREGIARFIKRNPTTSFVVEKNGKIVGSLLCGHDGRRGCFYHVCVDEAYRRYGYATGMAEHALEALKQEGINKVNLMAFVKNEIGNRFWQDRGWTMREDLNLYEYNLNEENVTVFQP